ncbi:MAG: hypothetical protein KKD74_06040 [Bacteroidetes bacterium]|nr:hypothetical protein [Bacteroidota bacterium]
MKIKWVIGAYILTILLGFTACKKEKASWVWCNDCTVADVVGSFEGTGKYLHVDDSLTLEDQPVYLNLEAQDAGYIGAQVGVINRFATSISGKYNDTYYMSFTTSTESLDFNILRNGTALKMVGTAKHFYLIDIGGQEVKVVTEMLDFEVLRKMN